MQKQLDTESLEKLVVSVNQYQEELENNIKTLRNAANVCDQAMGKDQISGNYINQLNEAIQKLDGTLQIVERVSESLKKDLKEAHEIAASSGVQK